MRTRSLIPAALLLCGCSLRHVPVAPEPPRGPARDSLFQLDQSRGDTVVLRGVADGFLALFSSNVVYLAAGAPVAYGIGAARTVHSAERGASSGLMSWEPLGGGVSADLLSGYTYGVSARAGGSATPVLRVERYVAYWQRTRGAPWRIAAYAEVGGPNAAISDAVAALLPAAPPVRAVSPAVADARGAMRAADSLFSDLSYRMGAGYAFSNTIAENGAMFGSPTLLVGPDAVRDFFSSRGESSSLTWKPVYEDIAGSRDIGFTVGEYVSTERGPSGAAVQHVGKYLTVWKRQKSGIWQFLVDGGNQTK
jgi:ketosteroid isomerase-like protein